MTDTEFDLDAPSLDVDYYRAGSTKLSDSEREIIGDVHDLEILVSPEGSGDEVLSLANLGARVTVYGQASESLRTATAELGHQTVFVSGALGEPMPDEIAGSQFDLIYSPWGTLDGIASLETWATDIADLLKPGGHLVAYDEHPVSFMVSVSDGELVVGRAYWGEFTDENNDGVPDLPDGFGPVTFGWALGDLITALGDRGLATVRLEEFEQSDRYVTALQVLEDISAETQALLPSALLLVAKKL